MRDASFRWIRKLFLFFSLLRSRSVLFRFVAVLVKARCLLWSFDARVSNENVAYEIGYLFCILDSWIVD
ncbi:hypothetical protein HanXRQr2_Chr06g0251951 [Helianthus annuus]|uniref:Uncharacterized protein n=1 Tax=Helianthus annuus TaxID=4232 RepID=A0A9K3IRL2_HELAN|nr:hypothetical protein HanXRQr2_Chr06g0251951 [Helianthus annuus]KAJ0573014.1 hypothetical protein HanHA89_Chr06g0222081 [Helianthus annuus]